MEKVAWRMAATGAAVVAGLATRKVMVAAWRKARQGEPPANPAAPGTGWADAIGWAVASGIAVAVARLAAARGAAAGWRKATGALPPGVEEVPV